MVASFQEIVDDIRAGARSNAERGSLFEQLMLGFLSTDALFSGRFEKVWLWKDWPGSEGRPDTGVDLVAVEFGGGTCAVQCKFYESGHPIAKPDIDSFLAASGKAPFTDRLIISTTEVWNANAEDAITGQQIPVSRIGLADLADSSVDWAAVWPPTGGDVDVNRFRRKERKQLREHQIEAIEDVFAGFADHDRGKLVMACGTGKTFTALKIAERVAAEKREFGTGEPTRVLFLLPSISLLSQTLREWADACEIPLHPFAVCSDTKATRLTPSADTLDLRAHDLALPSTTDPAVLVRRFTEDPGGAGHLNVVFSTYQSIEVIHQAQQLGLPDFDLIVCDEAHRTTGVTLAGADESTFVKVHNNAFLAARRRLYMTATPRLYNENTKEQAESADAVLCSMDDEMLYGPEFHRLGFGKAVELGLLTDYKVIVLAVNTDFVAANFQTQLADVNNELNLDDACKIVGCWNALSKRTGHTADGTPGFADGDRPMRRAVAFAANIRASQEIAAMFPEIVEACRADGDTGVSCQVRHVDGGMNALRRNTELNWLKADPGEGNCRVLTNARCLSEGVDVPSLDAVMFLNPRKSMVDVVQSVGRVMRRAEGKDYGYIILPVAVPAGMAPHQALADNRRFQVVWEVLQALRAHDERFNAMVNQIELNERAPSNLMLMEVGMEDEATAQAAQQLVIPFEEWTGAIYARIVAKVGERHYWEQWTQDIKTIAEHHIARINASLADPDKREAFDSFVTELRSTINPGVTAAQAIDMLAQHLITKPVFDALFSGYAFSAHNPVSLAMQKMLDTLEDQAIGKEAETLESFYDSVRKRAVGIDNHAARQKVINELYERFFKIALPKTADALGIVYTPVEVVDFILRATDQALAKYWGSSLSDEGVQVIDPFTGTGTFLVRAIHSGLIKSGDLRRKYATELHANEILLLAYYIAAINIEAAYHGRLRDENPDDAEKYLPFQGIVLTDTFQLNEGDKGTLPVIFDGNHERAEKQKLLDLRVVVGNPPYSVGQDSVNDNNQNQKYEHLDGRIAETYVAESAVVNKNKLYDSYIRAIRWASDRIKDAGVVCFVSNGGYIDGISADGLRKSLVTEFDAIYCYNLRGNQRTAGELSKREGGKIFGSGSRSTVAILLLVKGGSAAGGDCQLFYRDIGDYLDREEKLTVLADQGLESVEWQRIEPSPHGDWINHRDQGFGAFQALGDKDKAGRDQAMFTVYSNGLNSARDAWVYNYSGERLSDNMAAMIDFYNAQKRAFAAHGRTVGIAKPSAADVEAFIDFDPKQISWNRADKTRIAKGQSYDFTSAVVRTAAYRPFMKQKLYFDSMLNDMTYQLPRLFPTVDHANIGFYLTSTGTDKPFSVHMTSQIPDLAYWGSGTGRYFPRYAYEVTAGETRPQSTQPSLFGDEDPDAEDGPEYRRLDNINGATLRAYRSVYGADVAADDIFYYAYGLLHSPDYRERYASDLKKSMPRIPMVSDFRTFADAGRELAVLHLNYETIPPFPLTETVTGPMDTPARELYRVEKMAFVDKDDKSAIRYNARVTVSGIPPEAHGYMLGARSAIAWIIERYRVRKDADSGIVNDPNDWSDDPRYIIDLLGRIVTVSLETMKIVEALPDLDVLELSRLH